MPPRKNGNSGISRTDGQRRIEQDKTRRYRSHRDRTGANAGQHKIKFNAFHKTAETLKEKESDESDIDLTIACVILIILAVLMVAYAYYTGEGKKPMPLTRMNDTPES